MREKKLIDVQILSEKNLIKDQDMSGKSNDLKNNLKLEIMEPTSPKLVVKDDNKMNMNMNSVRLLTVNKAVNSKEPKMVLDAN